MRREERDETSDFHIDSVQCEPITATTDACPHGVQGSSVFGRGLGDDGNLSGREMDGHLWMLGIRGILCVGALPPSFFSSP